MARRLETLVLEGSRVRLEPLSHGHVAGLIDAASGPRDSFVLTWVPEPTRDSVTRYVDSALAAHHAGTALPFATVDVATSEVVGSTRFTAMQFWTHLDGTPSPGPGPDAVEIGYTWLNPRAQRTGINTEAKWLMLRHAFETWGCQRVEFRTDERNQRSRANIERVGATFEGALRRDRFNTDGHGDGVRTTVVYSIIGPEWPRVRDHLIRLRDRVQPSESTASTRTQS